METIRIANLLGLAGCAIALTGCAVASQAASSEPTLKFPEARYVGPITKTVTYKDGWITLTPPRAEDVPKVDWREAYAHCSRDAKCDITMAPTISYGRATITGDGENQKDGSLKLRVEDRLVYVLTYPQSEGSMCPHGGPPAVNGEPPRDSPAMVPCTLISYMDAGTGEALGAASWTD